MSSHGDGLICVRTCLFGFSLDLVPHPMSCSWGSSLRQIWAQSKNARQVIRATSSACGLKPLRCPRWPLQTARAPVWCLQWLLACGFTVQGFQKGGLFGTPPSPCLFWAGSAVPGMLLPGSSWPLGAGCSLQVHPSPDTVPAGVSYRGQAAKLQTIICHSQLSTGASHGTLWGWLFILQIQCAFLPSGSRIPKSCWNCKGHTQAAREFPPLWQSQQEWPRST